MGAPQPKESTMTRLLMTVTAALALCACDDEGGGASTAPIEDPATVMQAQQTGQQSAALTEIPAGADQSGAQAQITQVGQSIQAFAGQHQAYKAQAMAQAAGLTADAPLGTLTQAQAAEMFSYEDGRMQANINYDSGVASILYQVDLRIDQTDPGHLIDGFFKMDFDVSQGMYDIQYAYDAQYGAVAFDGAGCPIGGNVAVSYSINLAGDFIDSLPAEARAQLEQSAAGNGRVVASFGPNCGDVAVEGT
jgi:hypothetical protein